MKYKILAGNANKLPALVEQYLDEGWALYGDPFVGRVGDDVFPCIYQAVIKDDPKPWGYTVTSDNSAQTDFVDALRYTNHPAAPIIESTAVGNDN